MKCLITGDIHNGHNSSGDSIWAMKVIREYAKNNGIDHVLVLGDLFDRRDVLQIDVMSEVHEFFRAVAEDYNQGWTIFPGNHDMFLKNSWDVNSLQFLTSYVNLIQDISKFELDGRTFWVLPFVHHEKVYMDIVAELAEKAGPEDVLLTHVGVHGAVMNQCFLLRNWNIVTFNDTKFKRVFTGHFHNHQSINDGKVIYPGSPVAFNFDEGLVDHGFIEYDIGADKWEFINARDISDGLGWESPPDYVTITDEDDVKSDEIKSLIENNNVKVSLTKEYTHNELVEKKKELEDAGINSLKWQKHKIEKIETLDVDLSDTSEKSMMESFLEYDKPSDVNNKLILKLDNIICSKAEEIIAKVEAENNAN